MIDILCMLDSFRGLLLHVTKEMCHFLEHVQARDCMRVLSGSVRG